MTFEEDAARAADPACTEEELVAFLSHRDRYTRWNAAQNSGASDAFRLVALAEGDKVVAEAVGSLGDALSPAVLEAVIAHPLRQARQGLGASARRRSTMERIASDPDPMVRASLASGWRPVPDDLLRLLASDRSAKVRAAVVFRQDVPEDIARTLATDRSSMVRLEVLVSHAEALGIVQSFCDDRDEMIREGALHMLEKRRSGEAAEG